MSFRLPHGLVLADGDAGHAELETQMRAHRSLLRGGETLQDFVARRPQIVREDVAKILRRLEGSDAYDVLDLMRQREVMAPRMGYQEDRLPAHANALEVLAIILLARGQRVVGTATRADAAQRATEMMHLVAGEIVRVGSFSTMAEQSTPDTIKQLEAEYRGARMSIRNLQYPHIYDDLNRHLFANPAFAADIYSRLEFTYDEYLLVRKAISPRYEDLFAGALEQSFELVDEVQHRGLTPETLPEDLREKLGELIRSWAVAPGGRASFTAEDIAAATGVDLATTRTILDKFSVEFATADAEAEVNAYLDGRNPFANAALVKDSDGNYLQLMLDIGDDCFRQVVEKSLGKDELVRIYRKHRGEIGEILAGDMLTRALGVPPALANYHYFAPKAGTPSAELSATAVKPTKVGNDCEGDLLFVVDDVAVCVEVKSASFSLEARSGNLQYFANELQTMLGDAAKQTHRVEELIEVNGGIWLADRTWYDLSGVKEVHSIAVTIDDLGPLSTSLPRLVSAGVIPADRFPWMVSAHDLAVAADVLTSPAEFLLYLRRRTDSDLAPRLRTVDELDILMRFVGDGLVFERDPAVVAAKYPDAPIHAHAKPRFDREKGQIRVNIHTDPLDAWYQSVHQGGPAVPKPAPGVAPHIRELVKAMDASGMSGGLRAQADLLDLVIPEQEQLASTMVTVGSAAAAGQSMSARAARAGRTGFPVIVVRGRPQTMTDADLNSQVAGDCVAAATEWGCDRVLHLIVDRRGSAIAASAGDPRRANIEVSVLPVARTPRPPAARRKPKAKKRRNR